MLLRAIADAAFVSTVKLDGSRFALSLVASVPVFVAVSAALFTSDLLNFAEFLHPASYTEGLVHLFIRHYVLAENYPLLLIS